MRIFDLSRNLHDNAAPVISLSNTPGEWSHKRKKIVNLFDMLLKIKSLLSPLLNLSLKLFTFSAPRCIAFYLCLSYPNIGQLYALVRVIIYYIICHIITARAEILSNFLMRLWLSGRVSRYIIRAYVSGGCTRLRCIEVHPASYNCVNSQLIIHNASAVGWVYRLILWSRYHQISQSTLVGTLARIIDEG